MNENLENYRNYLKYERAYSDNTVGAYMNDLNKYEEFLKKDILESDTEDLEKYLKYIKNLESTTVAHKKTSIKSYFNYNIKTLFVKRIFLRTAPAPLFFLQTDTAQPL